MSPCDDWDALEIPCSEGGFAGRACGEGGPASEGVDADSSGSAVTGEWVLRRGWEGEEMNERKNRFACSLEAARFAIG